MTSGQPPSSPSAAKLGGFALIGVGALAAVAGVATLVSGAPEDVAAAPPSAQTSAPLPPLPPQGDEPQPQPPATSASQAPEQPPQPPESSTAPPPPPAQQPRPDTPGAGVPQREGVVRVYNNSTIKGLAHRAAEDFRTAGYEVPEVGNYARGVIPTTTVYYRPGTDEERVARELAAVIGAKAEPRFEGLSDATPGVIAIITNDYRGLPSGKGGS